MIRNYNKSIKKIDYFYNYNLKILEDKYKLISK